MLKILHTSDWHLGQKLFGWERYDEQAYMLDEIAAIIQQAKVDVLLVSGDIFDTVNPSAEAEALYYRFLARLHRANPRLQVVVSAGNHDSPTRLKAPAPLLKVMNVTVVSTVEKINGVPHYSSLIVPLGEENNPEALCLALPFLRHYDLTANKGEEEALGAFIRSAFDLAASKGLPVVIMAHLYAMGAASSSAEQGHMPVVMGHSEQVSTDVFPKEAAYVALGHIHRAQQLGEHAHIRYAGSPIPMSFSEKSYQHGVVLVELHEGRRIITEFVPIVPPAPLRLLKGSETEILSSLEALEEKYPDHRAPYLSVVLVNSEPRPDLLSVFRDKCKGKYVRLANVRREREATETATERILRSEVVLSELTPLDVAKLVYAEDNDGAPMPEELVRLFVETVNEVLS